MDDPRAHTAVPLTVVRTAGCSPGRSRLHQPPPSHWPTLHYGRIILPSGAPPVYVDGQSLETALVCLAGHGVVRVGVDRFPVSPYDAVYVPRDAAFLVSPNGPEGVDLAELALSVEGRYTPRHTVFTAATGLPEPAPSDDAARLTPLIGDHLAAGRLIIGVCRASGRGLVWPGTDDDHVCDEGYLSLDATVRATGAGGPDGLPVVLATGDLVFRPHRTPVRLDAEGPFSVLWIMATRTEGPDRQRGLMRLERVRQVPAEEIRETWQ